MDQLYMLKAFVAAGKRGSFSKAAEALGVTTGSISKAISKLEADIHTRLFHRTTRSIALTEEAQSYYLACCRLLEDLEEANRRIIHERGGDGGRLRLVVHPMLVGETLSRVVSGYRAIAPNVSLTLSVQERAVNVCDGHVDMAIVPSHLIDQSTVIRRKLWTSSNVLVACPGYLRKNGTPIVATDLSNHLLLQNRRSRQQSTGALGLIEDGQRISISPMSSMDGDEALLRTAALAGVGIAVLPARMVQEDLEAGDLVAVLPECQTSEEDVEICLFYSHRDLLPVRHRLFVDFCTEFFRAHGEGEKRLPSSRLTGNLRLVGSRQLMEGAAAACGMP